MRIDGVEVADTFAEAFAMWGARAVITADDEDWAMEAARRMTGMATSVIGCGCEAGIEGPWPDAPDGRPAVSVLLFAPTKEGLARRLVERIGQCVLTCPTTACYDGLEAGEPVPVGGLLRYFGDGWQSSKRLGPLRLWRIPVMDGEFVVQHRFRVAPAVGGGNVIILGESAGAALEAARAAAEAMSAVPGVILPFPGGIARSGSKPGSRYKRVIASTNDAFCPTLRGRVPSLLPPAAQAAYEIIADGLSLEAVRDALGRGLRAACRPGVLSVTAGNYGGKLGQYRIPLRPLLAEAT